MLEHGGADQQMNSRSNIFYALSSGIGAGAEDFPSSRNRLRAENMVPCAAITGANLVLKGIE